MNQPRYRRKCDMCNQTYDMNNREIPRIIVMKKVDLSDISTKDVYAEPDYCDLCIRIILKMLQRKNELIFRLANRITNVPSFTGRL